MKDNLPKNNVYAGVNGGWGVSGAGFWLSKDNIEFILNNLSRLNFKKIDDVAIGELLRDKPKIKLNRYDIDYVHPQRHCLSLNELLKEIKDHYHIRLKNKNRMDDIKVCKMLTKYFYL